MTPAVRASRSQNASAPLGWKRTSAIGPAPGGRQAKCLGCRDRKAPSSGRLAAMISRQRPARRSAFLSATNASRSLGALEQMVV